MPHNDYGKDTHDKAPNLGEAIFRQTHMRPPNPSGDSFTS